MVRKKTYIRDDVMTIASNRRALHEYFIKEKIEAGLVLQGWEVQSLRVGKVNIANSYVILKENKAFLLGANFTPLKIAAAHCICDSARTRGLLLHQHELDSLCGRIKRDGYTIVALSLYWKDAWCKVEIGIAKGKKQYEKRFDLKNREWQRYKARIMHIR